MEIVATVLLMLLLGGAILAVVWAVRQQRHYHENPDARPYGRQLLIRTAPFIVLSLAAGIWGVQQRDPVPVVLGVVGALGLGWEVWRRWAPPT
jgi:hypothetical protein